MGTVQIPGCYDDSLDAKIEGCLASAETTEDPFCVAYLTDDAFFDKVEALPDCAAGQSSGVKAGGLSRNAIIGIAVGGVALVVGIVLVARRRKS